MGKHCYLFMGPEQDDMWLRDEFQHARETGQYQAPSTLTACVQSGAVTVLRLVKEHCLQSGGADGSLVLWDVRSPQQPLHSLRTPDAG